MTSRKVPKKLLEVSRGLGLRQEHFLPKTWSRRHREQDRLISFWNLGQTRLLRFLNL